MMADKTCHIGDRLDVGTCSPRPIAWSFFANKRFEAARKMRDQWISNKHESTDKLADKLAVL